MHNVTAHTNQMLSKPKHGIDIRIIEHFKQKKNDSLFTFETLMKLTFNVNESKDNI